MTAAVEKMATMQERGAAAYSDGGHGDFKASAAFTTEHAGDDDPIARAWCLALRAQRWCAEPDALEKPSPDEAREFVGAGAAASEAALLACAEGVRHAVIARSVSSLIAWTDVQQDLSVSCTSTDAQIWLALGAAWLELASHEPAAPSIVEDLTTGNESAPAAARVEALVVSAFRSEEAGDIANATSLARRAWQLARESDLPQCQYLASIALARQRRLGGGSHLATRILRPLSDVAPWPWRGWIAWEALMAGSVKFAETVDLGPLEDDGAAAAAFRSLLAAAWDGDKVAFVKIADQTRELAPSWSSMRRDLGLALTAVDASVVPEDEELVAWCYGEQSQAPNAVRGLCIDLESDPSDPGPAAFVLAGPNGVANGHRTRRVAGIAERVALADAQIPRVRGKSERNPTTLAAVALAGPDGVPRPDLFKRVYGFAYAHAIHRGLFKALIHRVRQVLADRGVLRATDDDVYVLDLEQTLLIPDPRCEQSIEDAVLRALAQKGATSAKDAADQLGVSLRTAQGALRRLVDSQALSIEKEGQRVRYRVDDTTFAEPTKWS